MDMLSLQPKVMSIAEEQCLKGVKISSLWKLKGVPCTQEQFLSNEKNKSQLIELISRYLRRDGYNVEVCDVDADTKIVYTVLEVAAGDDTLDTPVVADDTDIAFILHWKEEHGDIIFYQERHRKGLSIKKAAQEL